ncbi:Acyl-CoA N-acyltransferase [Penicillium sp. IBT 35674x]|nr:Acyl-CoA N-acyltransferase [Penicillium sp. IBT 35674x]
MSIEIVPLAEADIAGVVDCVQSTFADDPYFRWAFDPAKFKAERNAASIAAHLQFSLNCGYPVFVAKVGRAASDLKTDHEIRLAPGTVVGFSWWTPPEAPSLSQPWSVWAQEWLLSFRQLMFNIRFAGRGGLDVRRYWLWKKMQKNALNDLWTDPRGYYYCSLLGVSSQVRGMGVGKRLMETILQKADEEGISCYLESSKGYPNIAIYEKMGFELNKEITCDDGGNVCKLYGMTRKPKIKA